MAVYKDFIFIACFIALIGHGNSQKLWGRGKSIVRPTNPSKTDEFKCSDSGFLTKVVLWAWPNPSPAPSNAKILLKLFTRNKKNIQITQNGKISNLNEFSAERKTVIICHGFLGHGELDWIKRMVSAYLNYANVNVIVVDWAVYANTKNYHTAAARTKEAGEQVAQALIQILAAIPGNRTFMPIHMIGFSLGAHVMGVASENFKEYAQSWPVERITGLDPAFPCFVNNTLALDKKDATFVDIIHTNGDENFGIKLGLIENIGHVDFYVNGGQFQPGCSGEIRFMGGFPLIPPIGSAICSHEMAPEYFIASLQIAVAKGIPFKAVHWDRELCSAAHFTHTQACISKCIQMGINAKKTDDDGIYFVVTGTTKPYNELAVEDRTDIEKELARCVN